MKGCRYACRYRPSLAQKSNARTLVAGHFQSADTLEGALHTVALVRKRHYIAEKQTATPTVEDSHPQTDQRSIPGRYQIIPVGPSLPQV